MLSYLTLNVIYLSRSDTLIPLVRPPPCARPNQHRSRCPFPSWHKYTPHWKCVPNRVDFRELALFRLTALTLLGCKLTLLSSFKLFLFSQRGYLFYAMSPLAIYIPQCFSLAIFNSVHSMSHPGIRVTQPLVTSCYVWPSINTKWACSYLQCHSSPRCHTICHLLYTQSLFWSHTHYSSWTFANV